MSIETTITDAWQRKAAWLWLLLPISWLYGLMTMLRRQAYKIGLLSSYRAPIPVMVIGNISVGGSGKTPLIIALVTYLQKKGIKVGVISRGYGGDTSQMPALVSTTSLPHVVGDEPCLIAHMTGAAMTVCPNRQQAITALLNVEPDLQLIIADDGLQHYALQRDIEWIVVDAARGFGNEQLLPTGFLREPVSRLEGANVIYHEKPDTNLTQSLERLTMHLQADELQRLWSPTSLAPQPNNVKPANNSQIHAVSGIGYPQRFFDTLESIGFEVIGHPYPDHYDFSLAELLQYRDCPIVVTSKDAVKISALLSEHIAAQALNDEYAELVSRLWVLPVTAILSDNCYDNLDEQLQALGIRIDHDISTTA
ncbi:MULTISPECIES: tetraacyldisaccharide 4'-kinase [unclassified Psychrobacter]|uniref:tetraacyldisaccharide 4'-kinase n=1 Tax=unclassified Psychrobacter TaxID=196806 RepID=UPI0025B4AFBA|nr:MULTISPECIES: tetraacyldisaccharide 4'-kinase [unclassified Psychrobacter]MDN3452739.1 tetraacyldisaccharide 4'-kinase [Psychrobacter sp. APC 3350]MDN3501545.1 tetraacyldisaccharide 4'-kinase [Psychrobacter sp. 5A.1]